MPPFVKHVFVCENQRPPGHPRGCCADKASADLRKALKKAVGEAGLAGRVRVNSAGCLDACEFGAALVVYPEGSWYGGVTEADIPELMRSEFSPEAMRGELGGARPLDRLRIHFESAPTSPKE